jgi:hypothetical protein
LVAVGAQEDGDGLARLSGGSRVNRCPVAPCPDSTIHNWCSRYHHSTNFELYDASQGFIRAMQNIDL